MKVNFIIKPNGDATGIFRYTRSLYPYLEKEVDISIAQTEISYIPNAVVKICSKFGLDLASFFSNYPIFIELKEGAIHHFTGQTLAIPLNYKRLKNSLVTVHDIIPYMTRHDRALNYSRFDMFFYNLAIQGLKKANRIISDSNFTKETIIEHLNYPAEQIDVVYLGVDHEVFRPLESNQEFKNKYGLTGNNKHILYVGSEPPKKNFPTLIKAFYRLKKRMPNVKLLKVGESQYYPKARREVKISIDELNLQKDVIFTNYVEEKELPFFYNFSDVFVIPSLYEGFGLPVLEAMACGTPVISSNATSLPELVGDAGITVDPKDVESLSEAMHEVLTNEGLKEDMRKKGLKRARGFTWKKTAKETLKVYEDICK